MLFIGTCPRNPPIRAPIESAGSTRAPPEPDFGVPLRDADFWGLRATGSGVRRLNCAGARDVRLTLFIPGTLDSMPISVSEPKHTLRCYAFCDGGYIREQGLKLSKPFPDPE